MTTDIKFYDLPEKMQSDWAKYIEKQKDVNILKIQMKTVESVSSGFTIYTIYFEYSNVLGIASYYKFESGLELDTNFDSMTLGDLKILYDLSTLRKELNGYR